MHYSDVLSASYIDEYKTVHRSIFLGLNRILFEIVFLRKSFERQARSRKSIEYKHILKSIYHNEFCMLVIDMYKNIFDNSGSDTMTLLKFKNSILSNIHKQYKENLLNMINKVWKPSEHDIIQQTVCTFRNKIIAHNIDFTSDIEVSFEDLNKTFMSACQLFSVKWSACQDIFFKFLMELTSMGAILNIRNGA